MDNESTDQLRFDRRLVRRGNWVEPAELEQELNSLPDVSDKIFVPSDEEVAPAASKTPEAAESAGT